MAYCTLEPQATRGHYCADAVARFWAKVSTTESGRCWLWTAKIGRGYGVYCAHRGLSASVAHRYAYELLVGPVPEGLQLDHLCRTRHCVNPEHLEPVTAQENMLRADGFAARNAAKTHCLHGHLLDLTLPGGRRWCSTCRQESVRRQRQTPQYREYHRRYEAAYRERRRELRRLKRDAA